MKTNTQESGHRAVGHHKLGGEAENLELFCLASLSLRFDMDAESVNDGGEQRRQCLMDHAVALHAGFSGKGRCANANNKMPAAAFSGAGMAGMLPGLIVNVQNARRKGLLQSTPNLLAA